MTDLDHYRGEVRSWLEEHATAEGWVPGERDGEPTVADARRCQRLLYDAGHAGISWPVEHGGQGLGTAEQVIFAQEAGAYDLPIAPFLISMGMCGPTIVALGTDAQKGRYLRPLLRGEEIWCQLFSEPSAGSDVASLRTRAVRDGDGWRVTGQKVWSSEAHVSRWGLLLARTDPSVPKHRGLTMFVLDMEADGVEVRPLRQMNGRSDFNEVFLDGVRIGPDAVVGAVDEGWRAALTTLMNERVSIGAAASTRDRHPAGTLLELARTHGRLDDPVVRQRLADVAVAERVNARLGERIAAALIAGEAPGPEGSVGKLVSTEAAKASAVLALDLVGVQAAAWRPGDAAAERRADVALLAPALSIAGGTDEILKTMIGERVLGLPKEPPVDRDVPVDRRGTT